MKDKSMAVLGIGTAQALGFLSFFLLPKAYDSSSTGEIYRKTLRKSRVWLCSAQLVHLDGLKTVAGVYYMRHRGL